MRLPFGIRGKNRVGVSSCRRSAHKKKLVMGGGRKKQIYGRSEVVLRMRTGSLEGCSCQRIPHLGEGPCTGAGKTPALKNGNRKRENQHGKKGGDN